ncbi:unnamed protein product [Bathycoccus prasinos]
MMTLKTTLSARFHHRRKLLSTVSSSMSSSFDAKSSSTSPMFAKKKEAPLPRRKREQQHRRNKKGFLVVSRTVVSTTQKAAVSSGSRRQEEEAKENDHEGGTTTTTGRKRKMLSRRDALTTTSVFSWMMMMMMMENDNSTTKFFAFASGEEGAAAVNMTARELQDQYWAKLASRESAYYTYWWALPLAPYKTKTTFITNPTFNEERVIIDAEGNRTVLKENVLAEKVWTFDQLQGLLDVYVNVRMTVVKLKNGGLWVHNPVAPTMEVIDAVKKLEEKHGKVKHIVVGSVAIEHKIYSGPFAQYFPDADVWLPKDDWTFPVNVKLADFVPIFPNKPKYLPLSSKERSEETNDFVPWKDEIEHETLKVGGSSLRNFKDPWFVDTAFYVKETKSLVLTDVLEKVSNKPVPVATIDPEPLYVRAMDKQGESKPMTSETRSEGWGKTVLFGLLFNPDSVDVKISLPNAADDLLDAFTWDASWKPAFENLTKRKHGFVPPVLALLAFPRRKKEVREWTKKVCEDNSWAFTHVVPAHLDGPFECSPTEFQSAIEYSLVTSPKENFGKDAFTLMEVSRLSEEIGSLEKPI